jgi:hypothetical protein
LEDKHIHLIETNLALLLNKSVKGRFKECRDWGVIYLSPKAITKAKLNVCSAGLEGAYYNAIQIYPLVVDRLNSLQKGKEAAYYSPLCKEML